MVILALRFNNGVWWDNDLGWLLPHLQVWLPPLFPGIVHLTKNTVNTNLQPFSVIFQGLWHHQIFCRGQTLKVNFYFRDRLCFNSQPLRGIWKNAGYFTVWQCFHKPKRSFQNKIVTSVTFQNITSVSCLFTEKHPNEWMIPSWAIITVKIIHNKQENGVKH